MINDDVLATWQPGSAPIAVVMITLNEGHNMVAVLDNLRGWAQQVFIVDSCSRDDTVDVALSYGVEVVQRRFKGFGNQWNFALQNLPISAPWTMKLDPDERLTDELKVNIESVIRRGHSDGISLERSLWLMGRNLHICQRIVRVWRTGNCCFTDISVNEHPIVGGKIVYVSGEMEHHDSPDLDHWLEKQNRYTTAEATIAYQNSGLAFAPRFFGTHEQRRMWIKKNFHHLPFRFMLLFLYHYLLQGTWRAGWVGFVWARLRSDVMRLREYKRREMKITGRVPMERYYGSGQPDVRVRQYK